MSGPYTVLNARVKQKLATEADWLSIEDELGVIFEGEQAFVYSEDGIPVNFKIGDGTKKFSELPYFIAYYSGITSQKVLSWINTTANITISGTFRVNSLLTDIVIINNSGSEIPLKVGTSNGGSEICSVAVPTGANSIGRHYDFTDTETVYLTGITGLDCTVFVLFTQMDESPAVPPTTGTTTKYVAGTVAIFEEIPELGLTYTAVWDFATGLAKPGFGYDNCVICGTNGTNPRGGAVSLPFKVGQTFGAYVGNSSNATTVGITNMQPFTVPIPASENGTGNGSQQRAAWSDNEARNVGNITSGSVGGNIPLSIQNYGIIDLWFKAVS